MSEVKVNKLSPRSGTTVTIGDSGDTINIVGTLQNNGSELTGDISSVVAGTGLSGGGTSGDVTINIEAAQPTITSLGTITTFRSTGIDDNANALAMTITDEEKIGIGEATPLANLHIKNADSGVTPPAFAETVFVEDSGNSGITIGCGTSNVGSIVFGDSGDNDIGKFQYVHSDNSMQFTVNASERMRIHSNGVLSASAGIALGVGTANTASNVLEDYEEGTWTPGLDSVGSSNESGQYTKIGNVCTAKFRISSDGSGSNINITGFPFTATSATGEQQGLSRETQTSGKLFFIRISAGNTVGTIIRYDASSSITSNDTFEGQVTYITNT